MLYMCLNEAYYWNTYPKFKASLFEHIISLELGKKKDRHDQLESFCQI